MALSQIAELASLSVSPPVAPLPKETIEDVRPVAWAAERILPVPPFLRALFPDRGLRRGSTVVVSGSTSLALAAMAAASAEGSWCAAVGMPSLGCVAAAELDVELGRLALVPRPGSQWAVVTAALLDALDIVLVHPTGSVGNREARRLSARARERGSVLIPVVDSASSWPSADLYLRCESTQWRGLGRGYGYLCKRSLSVVAEGKGRASQPRQALVSLVAS